MADVYRAPICFIVERYVAWLILGLEVVSSMSKKAENWQVD